MTDVNGSRNESPLAEIGETVWATARAEKAAIIIDAATYFHAAKQAMLSAQSTIMLQGWDFDARVELEPRGQTLPGPNTIGDFLLWLGKERPNLDISLLRWDIGAMRSLTRGETPFSLMGWAFRHNMHARFDGAHNKLAAHHMKLLVVDDAVAFCGGIDMTEGRWDTRTHDKDDPARHDAKGKLLGPWHDATSCVSGPAAEKLGALARHRWERATGKTPARGTRQAGIWPEALPVEFEDIEIGIARTVAEYKDYDQVSEIEKLTFAMIKAARRSLYIESQYLASRKIAQALAERLKEPEGPEIVLINPDTADGWLEAKAMDSARSKLLRMIARNDPHKRFRIFYPTNAAGEAIYVHAKIMMIDDRLLKIGSANLNNRSMGYDTECDILIDAAAQPGGDAVRAQIIRARNDLIAEHFGTTPDAVAAEIEAAGGLVAAMDALQRRHGRLVTLAPDALDEVEEVIAESDLVDPERPTTVGRQWGEILRRIMRHVPSRA